MPFQSSLKQPNSEEDFKTELASNQLVVYMTVYSKRFKEVNISGIIRDEIQRTKERTKDENLKDFLDDLSPVTCFTKNDNLSDLLIRADVRKYTAKKS